jgi:hypothetical protein
MQYRQTVLWGSFTGRAEGQICCVLLATCSFHSIASVARNFRTVCQLVWLDSLLKFAANEYPAPLQLRTGHAARQLPLVPIFPIVPVKFANPAHRTMRRSSQSLTAAGASLAGSVWMIRCLNPTG